MAELAAVGHDASTVLQESLGGATDEELSARAVSENRILVTFDLDFADVRRYQAPGWPGVVVFRLRRQDVASCHAAFARLLANVAESDFAGNLIIVEEQRIRIRRPDDLPQGDS